MELSDMLEKLAENPKVKLRWVDEDDVIIHVDDSSVLRIYPSYKSAEFLNIPFDDWEELPGALQGLYKEVPQLEELRRFMYDRNYFITW